MELSETASSPSPLPAPAARHRSRDLEAMARAWMEEERPLARTASVVRLADGAALDFVAIEDGRLFGVFLWGQGRSDLTVLLRRMEQARPVLDETWLLSTSEALGLLQGRLPFHVGTLVARRDDAMPTRLMPAMVNRVSLHDLIVALGSQSRNRLAVEYETVPTLVALSAAGRLAGEASFRRRLVEELTSSARPSPSALEVLRASRPRSDVPPPSWMI